MGKILILVILAVTIPRWALTLQQVDTFALAGIPIAAIGEAVVLELGNFYLLRIYNKCRARAIKYKNDWEALDERNQEQGKTTRKSKTDSVTAGHWILPAALLILEGLTVAAQTPFIAGTLLNQSASDLLKQIHPLAVIIYAFLLVVSPGLMTVGIGFGVHYEEALSEDTSGDERVDLKTSFARSLSKLTDRLTAGIGADNRAYPIDRPKDRPTASSPDRKPDRPTALPTAPAEATGQIQGRHWTGDDEDDEENEVSEALAGHLQELKAKLARRTQIDPSQNGNFRRQDVENLLNLGNTQAKNVVRYGLDHGILQESKKRYHYTFTN
jgi:hypothetical protein